MKRIALLALFCLSAACGNGNSGLGAPNGSVALRLINQSADSDLNVVFVQGNKVATSNYSVVAWTVAQHFDVAQSFSFSFSPELAASAEAAGFAPSEMQAMETGQEWQANASNVGLSFSQLGDAPAGEIDVRSEVPVPINVSLFRGEKLLGVTSDLNQGQTAQFLYNSILLVAVHPGVNEGDVVTISSDETSFNLDGIQSADILLGGSAAQGYTFALANVVH